MRYAVHIHDMEECALASHVTRVGKLLSGSTHCYWVHGFPFARSLTFVLAFVISCRLSSSYAQTPWNATWMTACACKLWTDWVNQNKVPGVSVYMPSINATANQTHMHQAGLEWMPGKPKLDAMYVMYIYIYIIFYLCVYVHMHACCMHVCPYYLCMLCYVMCVCICACIIYACRNVCMYGCMYVCIACMYVYMFMCMHVVHVCMYICMIAVMHACM